MKKIIAIILAACSVQAYAVDLELSVGHTQFTKTGNGIWYQEGFHYTFDNKSTSYSIGVTGYLAPNIRGRVAYTRLGDIHVDALAVNDEDYNGVDGCYKACKPKDRVVTMSAIQGLSFTAAPETSIGGFKVFAEAGVFVFRGDFRFYGDDVEAIKYQKWHVGPQIGAGIEKNGTQIVFSAYKVDLPGIHPEYIPNWQGWATNVAIRHRF